MDYSLLVGVVRRKFEVMERTTHTSEINSTDIFQRDPDGGMHAAVVEGPGTYYMGIIDVLQQWNWEKKLERFFKIYFKWMDGDGLSAAPPQKYVDRFMKRCVVEVFDGLYVADEDFNPKLRNNMHGNYRNTSRAVPKGQGQYPDDFYPDDADSMKLNEDRFRAGIDRRFSAAPLDNGNSLQLTATHSIRSTLGPNSTVGSGLDSLVISMEEGEGRGAEE